MNLDTAADVLERAFARDIEDGTLEVRRRNCQHLRQPDPVQRPGRPGVLSAPI
jgi:hypothetical protein